MDLSATPVAPPPPTGNPARQHLAGEADHNTFAPDLTLTDRDIVSLDDAQLKLPRQADGSLPVMTFLHLTEGSALIDAGVAVGLPFREKWPDLWAFER